MLAANLLYVSILGIQITHQEQLVSRRSSFIRPQAEAPHEYSLLCHTADFYWAFVENRMDPKMLRRCGFADCSDHGSLVKQWRTGVAGDMGWPSANEAASMAVSGNLVHCCSTRHWSGQHVRHGSLGEHLFSLKIPHAAKR